VYSQLRTQGEDTTAPRDISGAVPLSEIPGELKKRRRNRLKRGDLRNETFVVVCISLLYIKAYKGNKGKGTP